MAEHSSLIELCVIVVQGVADGEAWGAAMLRARGERVLDDPARLRRSLKKEAKAADKRRGAWAQRSADQTRSQADRQKKCAPPPPPPPTALARVFIKELLTRDMRPLRRPLLPLWHIMA